MTTEQAEQERLYHMKNAIFLSVAMKPPGQRNAAAYTAFLARHNYLLERIRTNHTLSIQDIDALAALSHDV